MKSKIFSLFGFLIIMSVSCVDNSVNLNQLNTNAFESIVCETGSGWTGWSKICTVYSDKNIHSIETSGFLDTTPKSFSGTITREQLDSLNNLIKKIDIQSLSNKYECQENCLKDIPTSTYTFNIDGKSKTISIIPPVNIPFELSMIIDLIERWNTNLENTGN